MQLRRSLYISFAAHAVVFGAALAFAHYGWEQSRQFSGPITLSLLGPGGFAGPTGRAAPREKGGSARRDVAAPEKAREMPELSEQGVSRESRGADQSGTGGIGRSEAVFDAPQETAGDGNGLFGLSPDAWNRIRARIEQAKTYPRLARERGIEGVVLLKFKVAPSGSVEAVNVVKSSGSPVLDEASVSTLYRAAPLPPVNGWIEVPMSYVMK